jgi:hypothetical protein
MRASRYSGVSPSMGGADGRREARQDRSRSATGRGRAGRRLWRGTADHVADHFRRLSNRDIVRIARLRSRPSNRTASMVLNLNLATRRYWDGPEPKLFGSSRVTMTGCCTAHAVVPGLIACPRRAMGLDRQVTRIFEKVMAASSYRIASKCTSDIS